MPRNCFFDARLQCFDTIADTLVPTLKVAISLKVATWGSGSPINLGNPPSSKVRVEPMALEARLLWDPPRSGSSGEGRFIARGYPRTMVVSSIDLDATNGAYIDLIFPLTPTLVSAMEEAREGKTPTFAVSIRLTGVFSHTFPQPVNDTPYLVPFVADDVPVLKHDANDRVLEVERSRWVDKILPGLGAGQWAIYEVPLENFEGSALADTYLANAYRQFASGEWKLCVAAARDVVETLERELQANANPAFGDRYGGTTDKKMRRLVEAFDEMVRSILEYEAAVKSLLAAGAHPERPEQLVERPDAEVALQIALSLRRYVGLRLRDTRPPTFASGATQAE